MPTHLKVGDTVPVFNKKIYNQNEEEVKLEDLTGKKKIFFFYPKDMTPGCTAEACSLRDTYKELQELGYDIYGISPDSPESHRKFIEKHDLPFDLLSDEKKNILQKYGVWGLKKFMGKEYMGVNRTTMVIDENNKITHLIEKVKTKTHGEQLLDILNTQEVE